MNKDGNPNRGTRRNAWASGIASVAIAGNNLAPVNTTVFIGAWYPLAQAYFDPSHLSEMLRSDGFVGREWLIREIDHFISTNKCGYFIIEADAGLGKTAFAWQLAMSGAHPCHFTCIDARAGRTDEAVRNLAAQLIAAWNLVELAPQGMLPHGSDRPIWLRHVLTAVAGRRKEINPAKPVVIVVDGLDEAQRAADEMPLGLPSTLPEGIFIVATTRTGTTLSALRHPYRVRLLNAHDADNRWDMDRYLAIATSQPPLVDKLRASPIDPHDFINVLSNRCAGVWIYLQYVLSEIRYGQRRPDQVASLPADLESYYTQNFSLMRDEPDWAPWYLPLLSTLCVAAEPLNEAELAKLAKIADESRIRRFLLAQFRPFCEVSDANGSQLFSLYHSSLRDYLAGTADSPTLSGALGLRRELQDATLLAHSRVADTFLTEWGGLAHGLPGLQDNLALARAHRRYGLKHLVHHLKYSGRNDQIHLLLACERDRHNLWFEAHEFHDDTNGYVEDLECAGSVVKDAYAPPSKALGSTATPAAEVRYALMIASISSRASQIPLPLLYALIKTGAWTQEQCLKHVRNIYDRHLRANGYMLILPYLTGPRRNVAQQEALATARAIRADEPRARALINLAKLVSADLQSDVLAEVRGTAALRGDEYRAEVLTMIADHLPRDLVSHALEAALALDGKNQVRALLALAPYLAVGDLPRVLPAIRAISEDQDRSECLIALSTTAPIMPFMDEAIDITTDIGPARYRAPALAALARHLPFETRGGLLKLAIESARAVEVPDERAMALVSVASKLDANAMRHALAREALLIVAEIADLSARIEALAAGCKHLHESGWFAAADDALQEVRNLGDVSLDVWATCILAPYLPYRKGAAAAKRGLTLLTPINDKNSQASALIALLRHCTDGLWSDVFTIIEEIDDDSIRVQVLSELAPEMPRAVAMKALATAEATADAWSRLRLGTALAPYAPDNCISRLLALIEETGLTTLDADVMQHLRSDPHRLAHIWRFEASDLYARNVSWHPHLPRPSDHWFMPEASGVGALLANNGNFPMGLEEQQLVARVRALDLARLRVLSAVAPRLSKSLMTKALTIARRVADPHLRAEALISLASNLPEAARSNVIRGALGAAQSARSQSGRFKLVCELARMGYDALEDDLVNQVVNEFVVAAPSEQLSLAECAHSSLANSPSRFLDTLLKKLLQRENIETGAAGLLALLPVINDARRRAEVAAIAASAVGAIDGSQSRANFLMGLLPYVADETRATIAAKALEITAEILNEADRVEIVCRLVPYLARTQRDDSLDEMIVIATTIADREPRCRALAALARHLTPEMRTRTLVDAVSAAEGITSARSRAHALARLAPVIDRGSYANALAVAEEIVDDECRSVTLQAFAEHFPPEWISLILTAALKIKNEDYRVKAVVAIVPRLSLSDLLGVCRMATGLSDGDCRVALFKASIAAMQAREVSDAPEWSPFRGWTRGLDRAGMLAVVEASDWWIRRAGGVQAPVEAARAIVDVTRWWP
jgi:hypothetical protein